LLKNLFKQQSLLRKKLGPLCIQLPPSLKYDYLLLEKFCKLLSSLNTDKFAIEFRNKTWLNQKVYTLLTKYRIAFIISDSPRWPTDIIKTTDWVYVRLHGKPLLFASNYGLRALKKWAKDLVSLKPKKLFIYFNNDANAYAAMNAQTLKRLLS